MRRPRRQHTSKTHHDSTSTTPDVILSTSAALLRLILQLTHPLFWMVVRENGEFERQKKKHPVSLSLCTLRFGVYKQITCTKRGKLWYSNGLSLANNTRYDVGITIYTHSVTFPSSSVVQLPACQISTMPTYIYGIINLRTYHVRSQTNCTTNFTPSAGKNGEKNHTIRVFAL